MNTEQLKTAEYILKEKFKEFYLLDPDDTLYLELETVFIRAMIDFASQESKIAVEKDRESRWISVEERLPEKNEWVLVYIKCKNLRDEVTYETHTGKLQGTFWVIGGHFSFDIGEPLFWQPLPEAPKTLDL